MQTTTTYFPNLKDVEAASEKLKEVVSLTPLSKNERYSNQFDCNVLFKREDLQLVRTYNIRRAYNKM